MILDEMPIIKRSNHSVSVVHAHGTGPEKGNLPIRLN